MGMPNAAPVATPKKDDKRFKDEEWEEHFLFDFIKQSYLIAARHIHDTVSGVDGLDEQSQKKVNFYTRQYIDALSPSNFAMTNPEVFRETVKSHGQNLLKGLNNLLRDVEDGGGNLRVKMTDTRPTTAIITARSWKNRLSLMAAYYTTSSTCVLSMARTLPGEFGMAVAVFHPDVVDGRLHTL